MTSQPEAYNPEASNFHSSVRNHAGVFLAVQSEERKIFCPKYGIRELKASQSEANNEFFKSLALMSMKNRILSSRAFVSIKRFTKRKIFTSCTVNLGQNRDASMQKISSLVNNNEQKLI